MTIKVVVDSGCDIPPDIADALEITSIPLYVNIGDNSLAEGVDISRAAFYANLPTYEPYPTTAAPPAGTFTETYEKLAAAGATEILSMHLSSALSNTFNSARLGADATDSVSVRLYDTEQITLGFGLLAICAAEAAQAGHTMDEIVALLDARVKHTRVFGMIDTMESLRRGGRVSWAQFGIGTLLQIKPVMMITAGEISIEAKVRTRKRAIKKMQEMVSAYLPFERIAVIHVNAVEEAQKLREESKAFFPEGEIPIIQEVGPAIGTHLGVGAVGFAAISALDD